VRERIGRESSVPDSRPIRNDRNCAFDLLVLFAPRPAFLLLAIPHAVIESIINSQPRSCRAPQHIVS